MHLATRVLTVAGAVIVSLATVAGAMTANEVRARVDHHLREVAGLVGHFESVIEGDCPRFSARDGWTAYLDGETERVVLLLAHLEQAWVEAKRSPDDDIRRAAKAPRRRQAQAQQLVDKLSSCATLNGAPFSPLLVWQRIEHDVPLRQAQIALPE